MLRYTPYLCYRTKNLSNDEYHDENTAERKVWIKTLVLISIKYEFIFVVSRSSNKSYIFVSFFVISSTTTTTTTIIIITTHSIRGAFSIVKRCVQKSTSLEFAAKIINTKKLTTRGNSLAILRNFVFDLVEFLVSFEFPIPTGRLIYGSAHFCVKYLKCAIFFSFHQYVLFFLFRPDV